MLGVLVLLAAADVTGDIPHQQAPPTYACACTDESLCLPLQTTPPAREIFAFSDGPTGPSIRGGEDGYYSYDWDAVTTVAFDPTAVSNATLRNESVCWAHRHRARVILSARAPPFPGGSWGIGPPDGPAARAYEGLLVANATARAAYVAEEVARVWSLGADGLNCESGTALTV
jgi:hypothetical protein